MRLFGRRNATGAQMAWQVEVDFGSGWAPYGPQLPTRNAAEFFCYDLQKHGAKARARAVDPAERSSPAPASRRRRAKAS